MPGLLVLTIVVAIIAGICALIARAAAKESAKRAEREDRSSSVTSADNTRTGFKWAAITASALAGLFLLLSCFTIVNTQNIGVKTAFGHPTGSLSNGLHPKWPWEKVTELDGRIQTDTYASNGYNGDDQRLATGGCVLVRIARQATACVNVSLRWQARQEETPYLFRNYHTIDVVRDKLLHRDLQTAINSAFGRYDPLGLDKDGNSNQPTNAELSHTALTSLRTEVGQYLDVEALLIPIFNFDPQTQDRLNQLQLQVAQTRIAIQAKQTARAQAAANKALSASLSHDPNVLVSKCLDILNEAVQKEQPLPAGFSCFGAPTGFAVTAK